MASVSRPATTMAQQGVWSHFMRTAWSIPHGKVLLSSWGAYLVWLATLQQKKKKKKKTSKHEEQRPRPAASAADTESKPALADEKSKSAADSARKTRDAKAKKRALEELLKLLRKHAWTQQGAEFVLYLLTLCSRVLITVKLSDVSGRLAGLMGARRYEDMFKGQAQFGLFCVGAAATTAAMKFLEKRVAFNARAILYEHLKARYLDAERLRFYHGDLSDAAARLTVDLEDFSSSLVHGVGHFVKPLIDIVHLSAVMGSRLGLSNLGIFYAYFWFSNWSLKRVRSRALPKPLKECAMERSRLQSELRTSLQNVHGFREQIAMQGGISRERATVDRQFASVRREIDLENQQYAVLDWLSSYTLKYGGMMIAFSILTPNGYYDPSKSAQDLTEYFFSNSSLLGALASAVKDLADSANEVPRIQGLAERVYALERNMDKVDASGRSETLFDGAVSCDPGNAAIRVVHADVMPPQPLPRDTVSDNADEVAAPPLLIKDLNLEIRAGEHTVIRGANGLGKSSLFRVLTQLWRVQGENPEVVVPASLFVLPQESFLPRGAALRELLTYPRAGDAISDADAAALLDDVGLGTILSRYGVDGIADWSACLSGGQKQRLGWARLFFHRPKFALCDEATAAISKEQIDALFAQAKRLGITLVTISHSPQVSGSWLAQPADPFLHFSSGPFPVLPSLSSPFLSFLAPPRRSRSARQSCMARRRSSRRSRELRRASGSSG
ncbi:ATP-binding cassette sub-family D member 1, partial [Hondaea fermentalgiana]